MALIHLPVSPRTPVSRASPSNKHGKQLMPVLKNIFIERPTNGCLKLWFAWASWNNRKELLGMCHCALSWVGNISPEHLSHLLSACIYTYIGIWFKSYIRWFRKDDTERRPLVKIDSPRVTIGAAVTNGLLITLAADEDADSSCLIFAVGEWFIISMDADLARPSMKGSSLESCSCLFAPPADSRCTSICDR